MKDSFDAAFPGGIMTATIFNAMVRTTATLDLDVQVLLRKVMKERGISFKEALNSAVRMGLTQARPKGRSFAQESFSLGREQNFPVGQGAGNRRRDRRQGAHSKALAATMIIVDVNLLICAVNEDSAFHRKAKSWRRTVLGGQRFWAVSGAPMA
jgi:hypothetical protein